MLAPAVARRSGWASLRDLSRYQWFVFATAAIAWLADCMDQQLFNLARVGSMVELTGGDPDNPLVKTWAGRATSVFLVGWATGGLYFGTFGDRLGRVRTLILTILLYSVFTGLSALSQSPWDYCAYRFLTGLGVGGVFAAAVSLLAEAMPPHARPYTLGLMQASSAVGNCTAALLYIALGLLELYGHLVPLQRSLGLSAWRILFLVGLLPAGLVIAINRHLHEPESWLAARAAAANGTGPRLGAYADLFAGGWVTRHAVLGMILSFVGVVGLWGIAFFSIDLQQGIFRPAFAAEAAAAYPVLAGEAVPDAEIITQRKQYAKGQSIIWAGITSLALNAGAFIGMTGFSSLTHRVGRRPAFALALVAAAASVAWLFLRMQTRTDIIIMSGMMGVGVFALFGGYAIWLPELFPTRLRATGTSFCYNVGRFLAASGPLVLNYFTTGLFADAAGEPDALGVRPYPDRPFRYAGVAMCGIFVLGLIVVPFLPETRDEPLPE